MVGLFFGSFNPIHQGHLAIARYLLEEKYCNEVWFVLSPCNPLKQDTELLPERERLEILRAALENETGMFPCDIEFDMPRPSYTLDTLLKLNKEYTGKKWALVIGADNLRDFHLWKDHETIARNYPIWVYPRPGVSLLKPSQKNITLIPAPMTDISSTEIRQRVREGKNIASFVPAPALPLILKYYRQ